MIADIKLQIDASLASFLKRIRSEYKLHLVDPILFESIKDFTLREGKRIRPLLLILSYQGYQPASQPIAPEIFDASTCMELLHNFMLIHDDIIDRSDLRRGKPTLHQLLKKAARTREQEKLGFDLSIIAGDIVYALAIDAFLSMKAPADRKERALKHFIQTAAFTAMGEFIDILHGVSSLSKIKEEDVFLNYTLKTARYTFECPLVVGAMLAGAQQNDINKLSELGILIGQAFQIQDDILGIFDSQKNIGKSILSDLSESKKTLLVWHANRKLPVQKRKVFLKYFLKPKKNYQDLVAIRKIFAQSGSLGYSLKQIANRAQKAKQLLEELHLSPKYVSVIQNLIDGLFKPSRMIAESYQDSL